MVDTFQRAWETKKIMLADGLIGFAAGDYDPSVLGHGGPLSSRFYHSDGTVYIKTGPTDTEWEVDVCGSVTTPNAGKFPFYTSDLDAEYLPLLLSGAARQLIFFKADGTQENVTLTDDHFPFTVAAGTYLPIPLLAG